MVQHLLVSQDLLITEASWSHSDRHITIGRTPLEEWSARRRGFYLTIHDTHKRKTLMPLVGFEPVIPASKQAGSEPCIRLCGHCDQHRLYITRVQFKHKFLCCILRQYSFISYLNAYWLMALLKSSECGSSGLKISMSSSRLYIGAFSVKDISDTLNEINKRNKWRHDFIFVTNKCCLTGKKWFSQSATDSTCNVHPPTARVCFHSRNWWLIAFCY